MGGIVGGIVSGTACGQSSGATVARSETYDSLINIIDLDVRLALGAAYWYGQPRSSGV
jgi:hypothetical protein